MWTDTDEGKKVVGEISKPIVARIAQEELEMYDELLKDHFQHPEPPKANDDPLGFGGAVMVVVTPVIAAVVSAVIRFLLDEVIKSVKQESSNVIAQKIKAIFNPPEDKEDGSLGLTQAQLEKAKAIIRKEARRRGMERQEAEYLALMIVARFALVK